MKEKREKGKGGEEEEGEEQTKNDLKCVEEGWSDNIGDKNISRLKFFHGNGG